MTHAIAMTNCWRLEFAISTTGPFQGKGSHFKRTVIPQRETSPSGRALERQIYGERCFLGHTPSTAGTFRKNSGKTPETLSEHFLEFPWKVRLGSSKPYNSRHLRLPEHFQNSLPPVWLGTPLFFRSGSGEGLSEPVMEFPAVLGVFLTSNSQHCRRDFSDKMGCLAQATHLHLHVSVRFCGRVFALSFLCLGFGISLALLRQGDYLVVLVFLVFHLTGRTRCGVLPQATCAKGAPKCAFWSSFGTDRLLWNLSELRFSVH